ncbi:hypothetical protein A3D78_02725 [Candidatus Gottesmanbacteria bacterium RIFCSPHIGHO2_02_FULL_39_14]|uniref:Glycosyltransferase RgtA/B/C/D-like domain-containing protein n=1 Tax=Candidatus Gottesmanbacteria bacterium RIFCSPHIGHO2_02_FULL_39_14 TaxID=1798383 RepID=A0A1F6A0Y6_9BACT|nr:MAG: hypothetical protein A3D78_02725 [Candidatus Gottesmanbacteria bacterium RIFCSPHIGHO2_02_FULL_39_14]
MTVKTKFFLVTVVLLALSLRLYRLDVNPPGLYSDEAAYIYNAFSLSETAKDEYGNFLPVAFRSFGDYKAPLLIYLAVPFVKVFGLQPISIRLLSTIIGISSTLLVFYLAGIFYKRKARLIASLIYAILPLSLQFNRMGHEGSLSALLVLAGLYFFLNSRNPLYYWLSLILFGMSFYAYHDARIFTPLMLLFLVIKNFKQIQSEKSKYLWGTALLLTFLFPLLFNIFNSSFWSRPVNTSIFADKGAVAGIETERGEDSFYDYQPAALIHNRPLFYFFKFIENYGNHLSSDFLFFKGDPVKIYQTVGSGIMLLVTAPLFLAGFVQLFRKNNGNPLIIVGFLLSLTASSLTRFVPSASRIVIASPFLAIIVAIGLVWIIEQIKYAKFKRVFIVSFSLSLVLNFSIYLHNYYLHTPLRFAKEWHYGMDQVYREVEKRQSEYEKVWLSRNTWGYIYALVYLKYPPSQYQPQAKLSDLNEYGFGWVKNFDKYIFDEFPPDLTNREKILFVGQPEDFWGKLKKPLKEIYYPDGKIAFYFADRTSFKLNDE